MKVNKKMLTILALNAFAALPGEAAAIKTTNKIDKMYDSITKNIQTGKSNSDNYRLIESVLKQKNKELKDLYLQGDYIVKPEYLEWQIFFSGFYNEKNKGDNTLSSARYYSDPQKANGDSTLDGSQTSLYGDTKIDGKFKPYRPEQDSKFVDLGVSLNVKGITKELSDINISGIEPVIVNSSEISFSAPSSLSMPEINLIGFNPTTPKITTINFNAIPVISIGGAGGGNNSWTGFYPLGDPDRNSIISQMDLVSGEIEAVTSGSVGNYSYTLTDLVGQAALGTVLTGSPIPSGTYTGNVTFTQAILKTIDNAVSRYGANITLGGGVAAPSYLEQILHYDEHYIDPV